MFDMVIEAFENGCNILMLVLKQSCETKYFKETVAPLCEVQKYGAIAFKTFDKSMGKD